ncbi:hypothetical protein MRX96_024931 [Rhipicephalus microplus]
MISSTMLLSWSPFFELYRAYLAKLPGKNFLELFFVNYAVAHCEHAPRSVDLSAPTDPDWALSPAARLNVALMNSRIALLTGIAEAEENGRQTIHFNYRCYCCAFVRSLCKAIR